MYAIEFETELQDGAIKVPEDYRARLMGPLKVIILKKTPTEFESRPKPSSYLQQLLESPLESRDFTPLTQEEIYAGRG